MHRSHHYRLPLKQFVAILAILIFLLALGSRFNYQALTGFLDEHRLLGMGVYFLYVTISTVIPTLPVVPVWPIALALYGFWAGYFLTIAGTALGASLCFWLARKYGRKLVKQIVGFKLYAELEHLIRIERPKTFLIVRILGNNLFDIISYIAGLSRLRYKDYIAITVFVSSIWVVVLFFLIQQVGGIQNLGDLLLLTLAYGAIALTGALIWELYYKQSLRLRLKKFKQ